MVVRNAILGGTDYANGEALLDSDMDDTNNEIISIFKEVFDEKYGDVLISGCEVTAQGTPNQTVAVSSGKILYNGLRVDVSADASVSLSNADGSNPRYDLISLDVTDGTITVTDGTALATYCAPPALPANNIALAYVFRAASDNTINTADIDDARIYLDEINSGGWTLVDRRPMRMTSNYMQINNLDSGAGIYKVVFKNLKSSSAAGVRLQINNETGSSYRQIYIPNNSSPTVTYAADSGFYIARVLSANAPFFGEITLHGGWTYVQCNAPNLVDFYSGATGSTFMGGLMIAGGSTSITSLRILCAGCSGDIEIWRKT